VPATAQLRQPAATLPAPRPADRTEPDWLAYRSRPTIEMRNQIALMFEPTLQRLAEHVWRGLPRQVDLADVVSEGRMGMMAAIDAFDPDKGVKFQTFCAPRIIGAIMDWLREIDWVPRMDRAIAKKIEAVRRAIEAETGTLPSDEKLAEAMDMDIEEFRRLAGRATHRKQISMSALEGPDGESGPSVTMEAPHTETPATRLQRELLRDVITRGLSAEERQIIVLYYYEGLTMREIGEVLGLSESRVSQMHKALLQRLKATLAKRVPEMAAS
jgi:RNA polymerase sigma factor for flagellar operon FliA